MSAVKRGRSWLESRPMYLAILLCLPAVSALGHFILPTQAIFKGHSIGVLLPIFLCILAICAWLFFASRASFTRTSKLMLGMLMIAWFVMVIEIQHDNSLFNLATFVVPVALVMVLLKPPTLIQSRWALSTFAVSLISVSILATALSFFGWSELAFNPDKDGQNRIAVLNLIGIDTRWEGPFYASNLAAPVGAFLLVFGVSKRKSIGFICVFFGLMILAASQGRNAVMGAIAGLLALLILSKWASRVKFFRWSVIAISVAAIALLVLRADPTFNGRTPIWRDYFELWLQSPWIGSGNSGINEYIRIGGFGEVVPLSHAHNTYLDIAARYGIVPASLTIFVCMSATYLAFKSRRADGGTSFALIVCVLVCGMAETTFTWIDWSVFVAMFVSTLLVVPAIRTQTPILVQDLKAKSGEGSNSE